MTQAMIFVTVLLTGVGCGIGYGSISTPFLITRMVGEQRGAKECIQASGLFLIGKLCMLSALGLLSALLGGVVLTSIQSLYPNVTKWMFRALLFCTAALLLYHTLHKPSCGQCQSCKTNLAGKLLTASYPLAGAVYAAIPCAPLVLALGCAASMKPVAATALLVGFGLANSLVPLLLYAPLTGAVVKRLREQAPGLMKWIRCAAAVVLLALTLVV